MRNILNGIVFIAFLLTVAPCNSARFVAEGSLLEPGYHIYWYRTRQSSDPQQITLYGDFRSAQVTRETFQSNASTNPAELIERGDKFDEKGRKIGERGVIVFKEAQAVRIFWTQGNIFWSVQAPTLELAREFEQSEIVRSITMSNNTLNRSGGSVFSNLMHPAWLA